MDLEETSVSLKIVIRMETDISYVINGAVEYQCFGRYYKLTASILASI